VLARSRRHVQEDRGVRPLTIRDGVSPTPGVNRREYRRQCAGQECSKPRLRRGLTWRWRMRGLASAASEFGVPQGEPLEVAPELGNGQDAHNDAQSARRTGADFHWQRRSGAATAVTEISCRTTPARKSCRRAGMSHRFRDLHRHRPNGRFATSREVENNVRDVLICRKSRH